MYTYIEAIRIAQMAMFGSKTNQVVYKTSDGGYDTVDQAYVLVARDIERDVVAVVEDYCVRTVEGTYKVFGLESIVNGVRRFDAIDNRQLKLHLKRRGWKLSQVFNMDYDRSWAIEDGKTVHEFLYYTYPEEDQ